MVAVLEAVNVHHSGVLTVFFIFIWTNNLNGGTINVSKDTYLFLKQQETLLIELDKFIHRL